MSPPAPPPWIWLLAATLSGGGTATLLPKVLPNWYRPDPATGEELRALQRDLAGLRGEFDEFIREGPREVRGNQAIMLQKLDQLLAEIRERGAEHAARNHFDRRYRYRGGSAD